LRALLAFFTVLPISTAGSSLGDAARRTYLLPLVGLLTGLPGAVILLLAFAIPPGVAATLALGTVLLAAGLHHVDGVMDVGDALMVRGDPARRREVMKDVRVGVGAMGALFLVYAPSVAALAALAQASPVKAIVSLLAAETAARSAMLLILLFGEPAERGSSSVLFVRSLRVGRGRVVALVIAFLLPLLVATPLGLTGASALLAAPVTALSALALARRMFGGISGDVSGATGEAARTVLLVTFSGLLL
jgi:adenosylcobinamide-GDP ribazoletransferase